MGRKSDTAYRISWIRHIGLIGYGVLSSSGTVFCTSWVRRIGLLGYGVLAESVLFLIFDQSIIYDVYTDVDTAYSSKSGNGLEFFKVFRYGSFSDDDVCPTFLDSNDRGEGWGENPCGEVPLSKETEDMVVSPSRDIIQIVDHTIMDELKSDAGKKKRELRLMMVCHL
ncbi:hypothetical protein Tco_0232472 [Tanacetum coccineum]